MKNLLGLRQKLFILMLIFIVAIVGFYFSVALWQQSALSEIVRETAESQQEAIAGVSGSTMEAVLESSMTRITGLQAYIAGDLFGDVKSEVEALGTLASQLFGHPEVFSTRPVSPPLRENDGAVSVYALHEQGVDPSKSELLGLAANMSETMAARYAASGKISGIFIGTADGNLLAVSDRSASCLGEDGRPVSIDVRSRPWYTLAASEGKSVFTGVETDSYTGYRTIECAAPVYRDGELVAVVGADVFLTALEDYISTVATEGSFLCIVDRDGRVLFAPEGEGIFSPSDLDLRESKELSEFIHEALSASTGLRRLTVEGRERYLVGAPMDSVGWAVISVVDAALTDRPTEAMLNSYAEINSGALESYSEGAGKSVRVVIILTLLIVALALGGALALAGHIAKPLGRMTERINALRGGDTEFTMEEIYRTGDEVEILAEAFTTLSRRTREYIGRITEITAEKERIGAELALATSIQANMLPNTYPAFPDRREFDIYAVMDPAREVGGDFYDFFLVDDDHLCLFIADVSGKGVPAALFMMASRIILAQTAKLGKSPAEILSETNSTICQNNKNEMFVTVWLGILEISTGRLTAANAGHEYPVILQPGGEFELYKDKHGFVLGGLDGLKYRQYELTLSPGSKLFLYTDGVPEATAAGGELFGTDRMLQALNENKSASPEGLLRGVRKAVDGFVKEAEQFDDLTMLALEYRGN